MEQAHNSGDAETLAAFKLATNDGDLRDAQEATTELVSQLKKAGKNPTYCVEESWLERTYGKRGEPRPAKQRGTVVSASAETQSEATAVDAPKGELESTPTTITAGGYLPDDVRYLKERVHTLEREKREETERLMQEIERNKEREAELFAQLKVKDGQISSWDEVTQGITKGLATGNIRSAGNLPEIGESSFQQKESPKTEVTDAEVLDSPSENATTPNHTTKPKKDPPRKKAATKKKSAAQKTKPAEPPTKDSLAKRLWRIANTKIG